MSRRITKMARKMSQMLALGAYRPQMTPDDWSDMRAEIVALREKWHARLSVRISATPPSSEQPDT